MAEIQSYSGSRIPKKLWERLTNATGTPTELVEPYMEKVLEQIPDLSDALYATPIPSERWDIFSFTNDDVERIARNWIKYRETFWAREKIHNVINDEFIEYAFNVFKMLYEGASSDVHLRSLGAGPLEDLLKRNGAHIIDRIEELASTDRRFRICLSYVWPTNIAVDIWKRILKARGNEPQRG